MRQALQRAWLRRGPLAWLLAPVSLLYGALTALDRALFASGLRRVERLPVPVIVVGNVVAGGAGKTPVVLALAEHLSARGIAAGIVSRGYGRTGDACIEVQAHDDPGRVGDEPLLLRRRSGLPMFVAARRADAGRALLRAHPQTRVLLSDDGLQHRALARDIEICVFDGRGTGNGWLLPAGPLREAWPRAADLVVVQQDTPGIPGDVIRRELAADAVRADGTRTPLASLRGTPVHAIAGIAQPDAFFSMLRAAGLTVAAEHPLPDHHDFSDAARFAAEARLVCTEKDAAKLWRLRPDAWAVPLEAQLPDAFWRRFDQLLDARLSSPDGSPPA